MAAVQHGRARHSALAAGELQAGLSEAQRVLLQRHEGASDAKKRRRSVLKLSDQARRACNREHLLLLDAGLSCAGLPLSKLMANPRIGAVPGGCTRHELYEAEGQRVEHRKKDGSVEDMFELSESSFTRQYTWHLVQDQGPKGFSALSFLWHEGCRGSYEWDVCHRLHNDWGSAVASAGMSAVRTMLRQVMALRAGPFRSHAHQGLLQQCVEQLRNCRGHTQPLWEYFYPDIFVERHGTTELPEYGTEESMASTFEETLVRLASHGPGGARLTRWFNFEQRAEELASTGLASLQYLLTYAMVVKGQWKKWEDTPMGQGGLATGANVTDDGVCVDGNTTVADGEPADDADPGGKKDETVVQSLRQRGPANKSISAAVAILCQTLVTRLGKGLALLSEPLRLAFGELLALLKSPRGGDAT
eukprot:2628835-Amphidinium_carterae.3